MATKEEIRQVYEALQERAIHPEGSFDKQGRWYPSDREDCGVSTTLRSPSRAYPYSYMVGCRTLKHCKLLAEQQPEFFDEKLFKVVAMARQRVQSVNDGTGNSHRYDPVLRRVVPQ